MAGNRLGKAFVWSFLEQGGAKVIQLIVQILLARLLAPEAFGVLAIMLVFVEIANVISQGGLGMALIQKTDVDATSYTTAFWLSLVLAIVMYVVLFAVSGLLATFYLMPGLANYLHVITLSVIFNSVNSIQRAHLQRELNFRSLFRVNTFSFAASGIVGVGMAVAGFGVWALVAQTLSQSLFTCLLMAIAVPWRPELAFRKAEASELFSYGWKIMATGILNVIYSGVSELIIGKACNATDLGYYSQGRKWPNAGIAVLSNSLQNVMFPAFSEIKDDSERLESSMRRMLVMGSFAVMPFSILLAVVAEPIVVLLVGEAWLPCVPVFQLACLESVVLIPQLVNLRAYMALGDSGLFLRLQIIKVMFGVVVIGGTALYTRDIYAVALSTCLVSLFNVIVVDMQPAKRMHGIGRGSQIFLIAPMLVLAVAAGAVAWAIALLPVVAIWHPIVLMVLQIAVFMLVYLGFAAAFKMEALSEWKHVAAGLFKLGD